MYHFYSFYLSFKIGFHKLQKLIKIVFILLNSEIGKIKGFKLRKKMGLKSQMHDNINLFLSYFCIEYVLNRRQEDVMNNID